MSADIFWTLDEICQILGVTQDEALDLVYSDTLQPIRVQGEMKFRDSEVQAIVRQRQQNSTIDIGDESTLGKSTVMLMDDSLGSTPSTTPSLISQTPAMPLIDTAKTADLVLLDDLNHDSELLITDVDDDYEAASAKTLPLQEAPLTATPPLTDLNKLTNLNKYDNSLTNTPLQLPQVPATAPVFPANQVRGGATESLLFEDDDDLESSPGTTQVEDLTVRNNAAVVPQAPAPMREAPTLIIDESHGDSQPPTTIAVDDHTTHAVEDDEYDEDDDDDDHAADAATARKPKKRARRATIEKETTTSMGDIIWTIAIAVCLLGGLYTLALSLTIDTQDYTQGGTINPTVKDVVDADGLVPSVGRVFIPEYIKVFGDTFNDVDTWWGKPVIPITKVAAAPAAIVEANPMVKSFENYINVMDAASQNPAAVEQLKDLANTQLNYNVMSESSLPTDMPGDPMLASFYQALIGSGAVKDYSDFRQKVLVENYILKAAAHDNFPFVDFLAKQMPELNLNLVEPASGKTTLHYFAEKGNVDAVKSLLERGVSHDVTDVEGKTPLQLAEAGLAELNNQGNPDPTRIEAYNTVIADLENPASFTESSAGAYY